MSADAHGQSFGYNGDAGRECLNCEAHVSAEFGRVMGDNDGNVHRCPRCANKGELARGAAADPDYEHRTDTQGAWR